LVSA
jgi:hypothetical protein